MNKEDFLRKLKETIDTDADITENTLLENIEEWDSLSIMSCVAFFDSEFNKRLTFKDMKELKTVSDIIEKLDL